MSGKAFQDMFPPQMSHCYGCGRLNEQGLQIKSRWEGDDAVCVYQPEPHHLAGPGFVYGGLIASIIDCHCVGTAVAAAYREAGREIGTSPPLLFLTASLNVDYLSPTPTGVPLEVRARVREMQGRKAVVEATVSADDSVCARGRVLAVRVNV